MTPNGIRPEQLGGFADGHAHLLRDQVDSFELLSNGWETVAAQRALVRMVRFRVGESEPLVQLQAFTLRDGLGYVICGTATELAFESAEASFREAIDGLRFATPESGAGALQVLHG